MAKIRISELPYLASASAGAVLPVVDNGVTYKTDLQVLETAMIHVLSASLDNRLDFLESFSSSFPQFSSSIDIKIAAATNEQSLGHLVTTSSFNSFTSSYLYDSASFDNRIQNHISSTAYISESYTEFVFSYHAESSSFSSRIDAATNEQYIAGLLLTSSYNIDSESFDSRLTSLETVVDDDSMYLTTESADLRYILSGSITQTTWDNIANKPNDIVSSSIQITQYGFISESVDISSLNTFTQSAEQRISDLEAATSSYLTTLDGAISNSAQVDYNYILNTPNDIISSSQQILDLGFVTGAYVTINEYNSLTQSFNQITESYYTLSGSFGSIDFSGINAITESYLSFTQSYYSDSSSVDSRLNALETAIDDDSMYLTTASFETYTQSIDSRVSGLEAQTSSYLTSLDGAITSSQQIADLGFITGVVDIDNYVTTSSYDIDSASFSSRIDAATNEQFLGGFATTSSLQIVSASAWGAYTSASSYSGSFYTTINNLSSSFDSRINNFTASANIDTSSFVTTSSFNSFTSSYTTTSASFDSRINAIQVGSASVPDGTISSSQQIETLGFITSSTPTDLSGLNTISSSYLDFTQSYYSDSSSFDLRILDLVNNTGSYETTGRGIISESVVTISETQPAVGVGNLWYDSNLGNLYLQYTSGTWIDTSNGVIQTIINDGSVLTTASFNAWTASYTASVPAGTISSSAQITAFGFVSGSYETTGRGIISSSTQISDLGFVTSGGNATFNSVTANQYIVSSSVYYVTQSYSSGSTIFGNTSDDTHQFTGSVSISGSVTITGSLNIANGASLGARLWQLSDVRDSVTSSADGYYLTYSSASADWTVSAGAAAKGTVRLYIATNRSNASAFYFNANTRTASDSASPTADTAFMVTTNLLNRVTVYLRQDNAGPNSVLVGVAKNADGSAFSSATLLTSSSLSLSGNTTATYQFSGLTINTFDTLHIYCDPTSTPGTLYGIVIID